MVLSSGCGMPGVRAVPGRVMSSRARRPAAAGRRGLSRAASICCLSWLKRMPSGLRASAGADFSQASLMSLRRPCLRPSQCRRKASASSAACGLRGELRPRASSGSAKAAFEGRRSSIGLASCGDGYRSGCSFRQVHVRSGRYGCSVHRGIAGLQSGGERRWQDDERRRAGGCGLSVMA